MIDGGELRVLCVDDDVVMLELVVSFINSLGYTAIEAVTFDDALSKVQSYSPHIIICDWKLEDKDGLDLCRRIRTLDQVGYIYFILLTAYGGERNAATAMDAGIDDFLTKPVQRNELISRMKVGKRIVNAINSKQRPIHDEEGLPVCVYCKSVEDKARVWGPVEAYLAKLTSEPILPDICPTCYDRIMRFNSPRSSHPQSHPTA
ncbi:MAG: response regulator [Verrucomicrobiota bacterium]|nr:response regulator [Verrucomicrobiota bacterium]